MKFVFSPNVILFFFFFFLWLIGLKAPSNYFCDSTELKKRLVCVTDRGLLFVRREMKVTTSLIQGLFGLGLSVGTQMADKVNPCSQGSMAARTGNGGNV